MESDQAHNADRSSWKRCCLQRLSPLLQLRAGGALFYSEDSCEKQRGPVNYNTHHYGIFQNGVSYFKLPGRRNEEISLIS